MSSPIFTNPSFEQLRIGFKIDTPASAPSCAGSPRRLELGIVFNLVAIAAAGALTASAFFGVGCYLLVHRGEPPDKFVSIAGSREPGSETSRPKGSPVPAIVTRVGAVPAPQPAQSVGPLERAPTASRPLDQHPLEINPNSARQRLEKASADGVSGSVSDVRNAMTWVVGNQIVDLWGVRPARGAPSPLLTSLLHRVNAEGPIACRRQAHSTRYRCLTAAGEDLAEIVLVSGVGRAPDGVTAAYRHAEVKARRSGTELWTSR